MNLTTVIAAVRSDRDFEAALQTSVSTIFHLVPNLMGVASQAKSAHQKGKTFFVHLDLAEGIAKDRVGIQFLKKAGVWLHNGATFGKGGEGFMRMNIACPTSVLEEAIERIKSALNKRV